MSAMGNSQGPRVPKTGSRENHLPKSIFVCLNVIIRVLVKRKGLVAILLLGFKVLVMSQTYPPNRPIK